MLSAGIRELKNNLSRYLGRVKRGEEKGGTNARAQVHGIRRYRFDAHNGFERKRH